MVTFMRNFFIGFLVGVVSMSAFWLTGWHKGFDVGYGAAMSDAFLNVKSPEKYFQEMIDNAKRGVSD